jgi:hypothetical protein
VVLTGYNTDIEHGGVVYHVQTEDKGRSNPFVESLVYASGEILYSRRTSYRDLLEQQVAADAVASMMERQHREIVTAIGQGSLDHLMAHDDEVAAADDTTMVGQRQPPVPSTDMSLDQVIVDYLQAQRGRAHLILKAIADHDFSYGETDEVGITAVDSQTNAPQPSAEVTVIFKSTAEPTRAVLAKGATAADGRFSVQVKLPPYNGGTSAVVVSVESNLGRSEIKHLVHR